MAGYDISVGKDLLPGLLGNQDGLAKLVETVLNQILEAQVRESLGADRHECSEERQGYRNGYRPRTLFTRVGPVTLQIPQTRDGSFSTDIFKRYQRSEQAFVLALMEMVVQRRLHPKGISHHQRIVWCKLFQIHGERAVCRAGRAGSGFQRTAPGRGIPVRPG